MTLISNGKIAGPWSSPWSGVELMSLRGSVSTDPNPEDEKCIDMKHEEVKPHQLHSIQP